MVLGWNLTGSSEGITIVTSVIPKRNLNEWRWEKRACEVEVKSREASAMSHDDGLPPSNASNPFLAWYASWLKALE